MPLYLAKAVENYVILEGKYSKMARLLEKLKSFGDIKVAILEDCTKATG